MWHDSEHDNVGIRTSRTKWYEQPQKNSSKRVNSCREKSKCMSQKNENCITWNRDTTVTHETQPLFITDFVLLYILWITFPHIKPTWKCVIFECVPWVWACTRIVCVRVCLFSLVFAIVIHGGNISSIWPVFFFFAKNNNRIACKKRSKSFHHLTSVLSRWMHDFFFHLQLFDICLKRCDKGLCLWVYIRS